ncbi:MAG: protein BatD [bacterium]|nr:protein BatD [bacterium]
MALALLLPMAVAGETPCLATARVVPEEAFVGQQVLYILQIEQRRDVARARFQPPLSFPSMRSEWLPTVRLPDPNEGTRAYQERRALHPGHAGELLLPEVGLVCETPAESHRVRVPATSIRVRKIPEAARPADWNGVVGTLRLDWSLSTHRVALGETVRLSVRIEGPGTVWRVDPGIERMLAPTDADVFTLPPDEQRDKGRGFSVRVYHRYDVVPRREGKFVFPGLRVASFDPVEEHFEEHVLPDLTLHVTAGAEPTRVSEQARQTAVKQHGPPPEGASSPSGSSLLIAGIVLAAGLSGGIWLLRRRAPRPADPAKAAGHLLQEARGLLEEGDTANAASALARCLSCLKQSSTDPGDPFAAQAIDPQARELALLEQRLERARFSASPDDQVLHAIATELGVLCMSD